MKRTLEAQATDVLRESIVNGSIPAGSRITEVQVSSQMKLSRATVRTALHQLTKEGLLTLVPYTGWTVVELDPHDVWELYTLRSAVERLAAQIVATSTDATRAVRMGAAFENLVRECDRDDRARVAEADFEFHKTIISLSGHARLLRQYELIEQQVRMYIRSSDALVTDKGAIVGQHRPIYEAILAGDPVEAGSLSEQHNLTEGGKLSAHLVKVEAGGS